MAILTGCSGLSNRQAPRSGVLTETGAKAPAARQDTGREAASTAEGGEESSSSPAAANPAEAEDGPITVTRADPHVFELRTPPSRGGGDPRQPDGGIEVHVEQPRTRMGQQDGRVYQMVPIPGGGTSARVGRGGIPEGLSGVILAPGRYEPGEVVTIEGQLPGIPVRIEVDTREFTVVEAPSPSNDWNRISLKAKTRRHTSAEIRWTIGGR